MDRLSIALESLNSKMENSLGIKRPFQLKEAQKCNIKQCHRCGWKITRFTQEGK